MPDKDKHFADNAGILKKIKSVLGLNIGTMLFGALFLYAVQRCFVSDIFQH